MAVVALGNTLAVYHEGKQVAVHRISYQKKDMVVNPQHYQKLTVKQNYVIDRPVAVHDLSIYDEVAI